MYVICALMLAFRPIPVVSKTNVEGRLIKESPENYLVDFSESIKALGAREDPNDYKKFLIKKTECIKE
jgi:hypothetical protein